MNRQGLRSIFSKLAIPACFLGPALMISTDIITIILNRNANPLKQTISDFAIGPYGWLEKIGMVMVAISFLFIAISLLTVKNYKELHMFKFVGVLFIIVASGFLMISMFNTNIIGTIANFHGLVHQIATIAVSVVFYLSCLILMILMYNRIGLRFFSFYCGFTFLAGFIVLMALFLSHRQNEYMGSLERIIAGFNLVWIVLVGPQVIKLTRSLQYRTITT
jgi:hypothetical protein